MSRDDNHHRHWDTQINLNTGLCAHTAPISEENRLFKKPTSCCFMKHADESHCRFRPNAPLRAISFNHSPTFGELLSLRMIVKLVLSTIGAQIVNFMEKEPANNDVQTLAEDGTDNVNPTVLIGVFIAISTFFILTSTIGSVVESFS